MSGKTENSGAPAESGGRARTNRRTGQGKEGLSPSQPGAQAAAVLLEDAPSAVPLQEAFPDHHPGTKLGVTEWNTALLRPLDSSASQ